MIVSLLENTVFPENVGKLGKQKVLIMSEGKGKRINVKLSTSAGRIVIDCVKALQEQPAVGNETITKNVLLAVRGEIEVQFNLRSDGVAKPVYHFDWSEFAYNIVVDVVQTAQKLEPEHPDNDFRTTLLKTLRDANPITRERTPEIALRGSGLPPFNGGSDTAPVTRSAPGLGGDTP